VPKHIRETPEQNAQSGSPVSQACFL
jgi:hypothetical protein